MASIRLLLSRLLSVLRGGRDEARLLEEVQAHVEGMADEFERRGLSRVDADAAARRAFGNVDRIRILHRESRGVPTLDALWMDLRFAARLIVRDRAVTAAAVLALALGLGATTAVFSIINGMNLSRLPVERPDRVVFVQAQDVKTGRQAGVSMADLGDWRRASTMTDLAAFVGANVNVGDDERPADRLAGTYISADAFGILRVQPMLGRTFTAADDQVGAAPVVILSHGVWRDRYGLDADVIGRPIRINAVPATVVGVMPPGFRFPILADLWLPLANAPGLVRDRRDARSLAVFGRLADHASLEMARTELRATTASLALAYPATNASMGASVVPFTVQFAGRLTDGPPRLLSFAVAFVLLIACATAANLLLARSACRAHEVALRIAMGASRGRIIRQLLVESVLLAVIAGVIGLLISRAGVQLFVSETADMNLPFWMSFELDRRVLAFTAALCLGTGVLFGLAPAWQLAGTRAHETLKEGGRSIAGGRRTRRLTSGLLVAEVALTLMLLVAAGLILRAAYGLAHADAAVNTTNALAARLTLPAAAYATSEARRTFYARLQARLDAQPTIESATIASAMPFLATATRQVWLDTTPATETPHPVQAIAITDRYFDTLRVPIRRGRSLTGADARPGQQGVVVNERFVARHFPGGDPLGRRVRLLDEGQNPSTAPWLTIVGVAETIRQNQNGQAGPAVYVPLATQPPPTAAIVVRGRSADASIASVLRQHAHDVDPDVALYSLVPLERMSELSRWIPRAMSTALLIVGMIALALATLGLYAVTAYGVAHRTPEIGIRMALGARRAQVSWLFLRQTARLLAIGIPLGLMGSVAIGLLLRSVLPEITPLDPLAFSATALGLASVAMTACYIPARRAARLDPTTALRHE